MLASTNVYIADLVSNEACLPLLRGQRISKTNCRLSDSFNDLWCKDTPGAPVGCDYWAWTLAKPRVVYFGDHWEVCIGMYNDSMDRMRSFVFWAK